MKKFIHLFRDIDFGGNVGITPLTIKLVCGDPKRLIGYYDTIVASHYFPERTYLHPKLHVEFVESIIEKNCGELVIVTNSDHIINRFRVAKKYKKIENLNIEFHPFDATKKINIETDSKGEFSEYPYCFLDEWSNQLLKLL